MVGVREWHRNFTMRLRKDHFPYMVQNEQLVIDALELYDNFAALSFNHSTS